jgi:taurine dioxygenase
MGRDVAEKISELSVEPITGALGAHIGGVDLTRPADAGLVAELEHLIAVHKVLVFTGQTAVGPSELVRFARHFGAPETVPHPDHADCPGEPGVKVIEYDCSPHVVDQWHTDGATRANTRWLSFLQAVDVPPYGRDTLFADMEAAFEGLSPLLQDFLAGMNTQQSWGGQKPGAPPVVHPAVVTNPVTGRRALYVNRIYTTALEGLRPKESQLLLEYLKDLAFYPDYQMRVRWKPGTIAMWDNERTQHYVAQDKEYHRIMHRVMVQRW